ncbi:hypothetical protein MMAN_58250 [Mycobacterium mantenii]|uniref:Transposase n=1 Tax=Mycobacterium mantenii TaxID=560555 RepID=A0A1X0G4I3_MYCNT|nr:hypothetical protein [Mycobacterium mantenii]MCV7243842.1 hypothetical protein [Mycobacterium mantenii]ORB08708.1 hypothetical protein BST30_01850 [Mycobacterium mantenii]BBY35905.1 hypothetical protein MMAN_00390 [Mycobacterium mantenii]BBY41691.1 hypothetical protein MMAN_58250 [Mycobacterium mantenii]
MTDDELPQDEAFKAERARLFAEIATLKDQRNELQRQLAECQRENSRLRAQPLAELPDSRDTADPDAEDNERE